MKMARYRPSQKFFDKAEKIVKVRTLLDDVARLKNIIDEHKLALESADKQTRAQLKLRIQEAGERIQSLENIIDKARENQQKEENERS